MEPPLSTGAIQPLINYQSLGETADPGAGGPRFVITQGPHWARQAEQWPTGVISSVPN